MSCIFFEKFSSQMGGRQKSLDEFKAKLFNRQKTENTQYLLQIISNWKIFDMVKKQVKIKGIPKFEIWIWWTAKISHS